MCTATQLVVIKTSEISRWKSMLRLFSKWPVFIRELTFFQGEIQIANEHMKRCSAALVMELKVTQSCLTLCDPMDFTVHGILQARILEWVDFPFARGFSHPRDWTRVFCIVGGFFTIWAMREAPIGYEGNSNQNHMENHFPLTKKAIIRKSNNDKLWWGCAEILILILEFSNTAGGDENWCGHFGKQCGRSLND